MLCVIHDNIRYIHCNMGIHLMLCTLSIYIQCTIYCTCFGIVHYSIMYLFIIGIVKQLNLGELCYDIFWNVWVYLMYNRYGKTFTFKDNI